MTGGTIINAALRELKVLMHPGQTPAPEEQADGLLSLNNIVDEWSTERLLVPYVSFARYALVGAKPTYTIGLTGGDLTGPRPIRIDAAGIVQLAYNGAGADFRSDIAVISERDWVAIKDKTATADIPTKLYYAPTLTGYLGTLYLWPIPNVISATSLELSAWAALASFPDQTTDVPLAPGYAHALIYALAIDLAPAMPTAQLTQTIMDNAAEAKRSIMKLNSLLVPPNPDIATPPATDVQFMPVPATLATAVRLAQPGMQGALQAAQNQQQR
jgi:hypothetical protein